MQVWMVVTLMAALMVVGSIMWIMPSKHDRRIAKLRQQAIVSGIKVKLMKYPVINVSGRVEENCHEGASYSFVDVPLKGVKTGWMLIRSDDQSEPLDGVNENKPIDGWGWYIKQDELQEEIIAHIMQLTSKYSESLFAVSIMARSISIGWSEAGNQQDLDDFKVWAATLADLMNKHFVKEDDHQGLDEID